jgi:hypothetical protein
MLNPFSNRTHFFAKVIRCITFKKCQVKQVCAELKQTVQDVIANSHLSFSFYFRTQTRENEANHHVLHRGERCGKSSA